MKKAQTQAGQRFEVQYEYPSSTTGYSYIGRDWNEHPPLSVICSRRGEGCCSSEFDANRDRLV